MKTKLITLLITTLFSLSTYAASGSLWGDIDEPVKDLKQIESEERANENANTEKSSKITLDDTSTGATQKVATETEEPQMTICEILTQTPSLSIKNLQSTVTLGKIRTIMNAMPDEYKALTSTPEATNKLYDEYRKMYIKTYCTRAASSG